jgi:ABC-type glycerol-3-phosphate transport system permease component
MTATQLAANQQSSIGQRISFQRVARILAHVILILTCVIVIFPVIWAISTSLKM